MHGKTLRAIFLNDFMVALSDRPASPDSERTLNVQERYNLQVRKRLISNISLQTAAATTLFVCLKRRPVLYIPFFSYINHGTLQTQVQLMSHMRPPSRVDFPGVDRTANPLRNGLFPDKATMKRVAAYRMLDSNTTMSVAFAGLPQISNPRVLCSWRRPLGSTRTKETWRWDWTNPGLLLKARRQVGKR